MGTAADVPEELAEIEAGLLAPGAPFETRTETVLGEEMPVFASRMHSLRDLLVASEGFGASEYLVFSDGDHDRRFTFAEHARNVAATAAALARRGVGPGDRVAILGANSPEWIVTFWATVSLGAVAVACNAWWTGPEIRFALDDVEPTLLVCDRRRHERLGGDPEGVATLVLEDDVPTAWRVHHDAVLPAVSITEDAAAVILYTSGTTGRPKGAVHTHRNVLALLGVNFFHGLRVSMLHPPDPDGPANCQLVSSPLFHVSGLHNAAIAFLAGGVKSVWTTGRFDPRVVMRLIERERVTGWSFTATMLRRVVEHPAAADHDLSSLRSGGGGGSPFPAALQRRAKAVLPGLHATMGVGYGCTECTGLATLNTGAELDAHPDSVGRPLPTVQLEIRDPDRGVALPEGAEGEVCIRGPMVMLEYWRRPGDTAAAIGPGRWLRTGDLGRLEGGRLFLAARTEDLILRGGENVYPAEIEHRLEEHPLVAEAAVVGVAHDDLGEVPKAVVVLAAGVSIEHDDLVTWCAETLAYYKVPAHWELRGEPLPRNAAGKVVKHALREDAPSPFVEE